jgi:hypothetical protein
MSGSLLGMILSLFMATASAIFAIIKNVMDKINPSPSTIPTTIPTTIIPSQNITTIPSISLETAQISVPFTIHSSIPTPISSTIFSSNLKTTLETAPKTNEQIISTTALNIKTILQTRIEYSTIYYPACASTYFSLVDALKSIGEDSSFSKRKLIAQINGILNYSGTSQENIELLNKLKNGILIKTISSTIINAINTPTLDTSNPLTPSATVPINAESRTIPISVISSQKQTEVKTEDVGTEDKLVCFPACDKKFDRIEKALESIGAFSSSEYIVKIGEVNNIPTSDSTKLNNELLKRLKNGTLIRPSLNLPPFQAPPENSDDMIKKLEESKNKNIERKKNTLIIMGKVLFNFGYEPAFVAGILANINGEGEIGLFERSNYRNQTLKPDYLKYMDNNYDYAKNYSGKYIYKDISLFNLQKLLNELAKNGWKGKFGIGCIQWTKERTIPLINLYLEEAGFKDKITFDQATSAESKMIINELTYSKEHNKIYTNWKKKNSNINNENAASDASKRITTEYEKPKGDKSKERAGNATLIYNIMTS